MDSVGIVIINLGEFVQAFILVCFIHGLFGFRDRITDRKTKLLILSVMLFGIARVGVAFAWNDLVTTVLWIVILLVYSELYLKNTVLYHLMWCMYGILLIPLIQIILLLITSALLRIPVEQCMNIESPVYLLLIIIARILYFGIWFLTIQMYRVCRTRLPRRYGIVIVILLGYSVVIESILFAGFELDTGGSYKLGLIGIAVGIVLIDICLFAMIFKISKKYEQEEALKLLQIQNQLQQKRLKEAETETQRIRQMRHDYKNLISNLGTMLQKKEYKEAEAYLREINGYYLKSVPEYVNTHNPMIDAAINTKFTYCNEKGIATTCKILGECENMDDFRLAIIILNLLDNAIEASLKEKEKEIDLQLKQEGAYIHLIVKNKIEKSILEENPELRTTKKEVGHGIGLNHINSILEENEGLLEAY